MGFEIDKSAEELQREKNKLLRNELNNEAKTASDGVLSDAENQDLTLELAGEAQTTGFTEEEAENLTQGLSGQHSVNVDKITFTKVDENGLRQTVSLYGEEQEGFLNFTADSLQYFLEKYPNVAKAYLSGGIVTLLDKNNVVIRDIDGNPVTIDYNSVKNDSRINLVQFYLEHNNGNFDINKMLEMQTLQDRINSTSETDSSYIQLLSEIEVEKLDMMSESERKNYITAKMWNAYNNGDSSAWFQALGEFFDYECKVIDRKLGITGAKDFIREHTHLNDLVSYIDKIVDNEKNNLTKAELIWEIVKGVGDAIDSFIGTQGLTMMGVLGASTKAASAIPKIGPLIGGAIQAYFGTEGAVLIASGTIDAANAETKEEARGAGNEIGLGGIMASGGIKALKASLKGLEVKAYRSKIGEASTLEELKVIEEILNEMPYSNAEKQSLRMECTKQQGKIQGRGDGISSIPIENGKTNISVSEVIEQQRIRSKAAFTIMKYCKTSVQREMVKEILNNPNLYMALKEPVFSTEIFKQIIEDCKTLDDVQLRKHFIEKASENPKFIDENGAFNEYILYCIMNCYPENIDMQFRLMDMYKNSNTELDGYAFGAILYRALGQNESYFEAIQTILNSKKIDISYINKIAHARYGKEPESIIDFLGLCIKSQNGMVNGFPLEDVLLNYNLRKIIQTTIYNCDNTEAIIKLRDEILKDKALQNPELLKVGEIPYAEYISKMLQLSGNFISSDSALKIKFISDVLLDKSLGKNPEILKLLQEKIVERNSYYNKYLYLVYEGLKYGVEENCSYEELCKIFDELGRADRIISNSIKDIEANGFNISESASISERVIYDKVITENKELLLKFTEGREHTSEDIVTLFDRIEQKSFCKNILSQLCSQQEYSANNILKITESITEKNIGISRKVLDKNDLSPDEKTDVISAINLYRSKSKIIEILASIEDFDLKRLPRILTNVCYASSEEKFIKLIQNPKTSHWAVQMLNNGWDVTTIEKLSTTKLNFHNKDENIELEKDPNVRYFMDFGMDAKEANSIVKAITKRGALNTEMQQAAIDLVNADVPRYRIGDILNSATITGEYNTMITADAISVLHMGLNGFLERHLPVLNNLSAEDIAIKYKPKVKEQLKGMINLIPQETIPALRAKGFDIDGILSKLKAKMVQTTDKVPSGQKGVVHNDEFRTRQSITGLEKVLIDKYSPVESVWRSKSKTKEWAERKYKAIKDNEYKSERNGINVDIDNVNKMRKEGLKVWFDFMETEPELQNNPFARVLIGEFITKDLLAENSALPPDFDKALVKKVLIESINSNKSFSELYSTELSSSAQKTTKAKKVDIDGRKMTWYTVPKTDSSHPDYNTNVAKVRAFSEGTNWCIKDVMAPDYIQKGDISFLVDEAGLTQACIRQDGPKHIAEIQKRQQNTKPPVAYIDFIQNFVKTNKLKGCKEQISEVAKEKPKFDKTKSELQTYAENNNYKAIFEKLGIEVKELPDGTLEISHYTPLLQEISLNDYGINENGLLANVSRIRDIADFRESNVTKLPKLKEAGTIYFGNTDISLQELEKIGNKKIIW